MLQDEVTEPNRKADGRCLASASLPETETPAPTEVEAGDEPPESGRPDSNRRRPAWEAGILPLNYARGIALQRLTCFRLEEYGRKQLAHQALFDTGWHKFNTRAHGTTGRLNHHSGLGRDPRRQLRVTDPETWGGLTGGLCGLGLVDASFRVNLILGAVVAPDERGRG